MKLTLRHSKLLIFSFLINLYFSNQLLTFQIRYKGRQGGHNRQKTEKLKYSTVSLIHRKAIISTTYKQTNRQTDKTRQNSLRQDKEAIHTFVTMYQFLDEKEERGWQMESERKRKATGEREREMKWSLKREIIDKCYSTVTCK